MRDETAATAAEMANLAAQATTAASRIGQVFTGGGSMAPVLGLIRGTEEWIAEQERLNGLTSEQITLESEIGRLRRDAKDAGAAVTDAELERLARERIAAEERRAAAARAAAAASRGGGGGNAELREANELNRDAERIIRSVRTATEEYNATLADLKRLLDAGAISQEVYGRAAAEAEERLAAATAAEREAALAKSDDPFEGARAGMQEYAEETLSTAEMIRDSVVDAFSAAEDAVGDFVRTGKLEVRSLVSSIIADMAQLMIRQRVLTPLANWLGGLGGGGAGAAAAGAASGGGGGFFSGLISGIGRVFGGERASGGPVAAGLPYLVGERGPELVIPRAAGTVVPNHALVGGRPMAINVNVSGARGNQEIMQMVQSGVMQGLRAYDAQLPDRVSKIGADPRFRG
jgi:lambda family phage tail tape measure protein